MITEQQIEAGAKAIWETFPYLCEDFSYEWFIEVARTVLETQFSGEVK